MKARFEAIEEQPINAQTGTTYTVAATDVGKLVTLSNAAAITVTMPQDSAVTFAVGARVDFAVIGADRIARNGDTANKIGSVSVALACAAAGIPFVVAAPSSTVDLATASGEDIEIELRSGDEVTTWAGLPTTPSGARGFNPAFDVTPAAYISAVVTEFGVVEPGPGVTVDAIAEGAS